MTSLKEKGMVLLATGLGAGYAPFAPGTVGSLWGVLIFYVLRFQPLWVTGLVVVLLTVVGVMASGATEKIFGKKDPGRVVIDEVAGQVLTYLTAFFIIRIAGGEIQGGVTLPLQGNSLWVFLGVGFLLFRLADIVKIFPARTAQDKLPGGWGVMTDDLVAGVQAGVVLGVIFLKF